MDKFLDLGFLDVTAYLFKDCKEKPKTYFIFMPVVSGTQRKEITPKMGPCCDSNF